MNLPSSVSDLIARLRDAGYPAYAVGGCVRDALLGRTPHDWDLCTSATPEEMKQVFAGEHVVETGIKHGTLTVVRDHIPYEVTSFRTDGPYSDHRHPDSVAFVTDLREDLSRRDFTINAMAYSPDEGLVDLFGGQDDLAGGIVRCVGKPEERFREDALRILRALRFASTFGFALEADTARAVHLLAPTLRLVAAERIRVELLKMLCGPAVGRILREYPDVLAVIIPDLAGMPGYDQLNHHHRFDLWEHTVQAVENIPPEEDLRLTMLLHDTGKPASQTIDEKGEAHYRGHQAISADIARRVTEHLHCDRDQQERVTRLVMYHDIPLRTQDGAPATDRRFLLHRLHQFGERDLRALFQIHRADRIATGITSREREDERMRQRMDALDAVLREQPCFTLKDLAVNGHDLMALGLRGQEIGKALNRLLSYVMDGKLPNERTALLSALQHQVSDEED